MCKCNIFTVQLSITHRKSLYPFAVDVCVEILKHVRRDEVLMSSKAKMHPVKCKLSRLGPKSRTASHHIETKHSISYILDKVLLAL